MIDVIPAIDLIDGCCVRLSQGDFAQSKIYSDDPLEVAKRFEGSGLRRLHIVDLDGARSGKLMNLAVLESISANTDLSIDFGGGIKTGEDLKAVFDAGASMASIGSLAVKTPDRFFEWVDDYGSGKILLGADVRNRNLAIDAWQTATETDIVPFLLQYFTRCVRQVFVTDIAKDGVLQGPSIDLYKEIREALPDLRLIASGGVSSIADIERLKQIGCRGVIVGRAIYEGKIALEELRSYVS